MNKWMSEYDITSSQIFVQSIQGWMYQFSISMAATILVNQVYQRIERVTENSTRIRYSHFQYFNTD